ncbi:CDC27 family protein [Lyticum sinuosum]|uniref:ANAPC3 domain-containing protein n=1 Tax=Lyticum sinuosum TaxID=1332059 RepID=A0AAE4VKE9_9RICK|nr:CDC27 family protein [Lyticum sinuosum]MDZ5761620.1 putative ANAPC3 domain-containing protein [Lyticum sinuosum]
MITTNFINLKLAIITILIAILYQIGLNFNNSYAVFTEYKNIHNDIDNKIIKEAKSDLNNIYDNYNLSSININKVIINCKKDSDIAIFTRSNKIWIVLNIGYEDIISYTLYKDLNINKNLKFRLGDINKTEIVTYPSSYTKSTSVFIIPIISSQDGIPSIFAKKDGNKWHISISAKPNIFMMNYSVKDINYQLNNKKIIIKTDQKFAKEISFIDPMVGDLITVIPSSESNIMTMVDRSFIDFDIISSNSGLVIKNKSDDLYIHNNQDYISIENKDKTKSLNLDCDEIINTSFSSLIEEQKNSLSILNLKSLEENGNKNFSSNIINIDYKIPYLSSYDKTRFMIDLAKYYLKNQWFDESIAMMNFAVNNTPSLQRDYKLFIMYFLAFSAMGKSIEDVDINKIDINIIPENKREEVIFLKKIMKYMSPYYDFIDKSLYKSDNIYQPINNESNIFNDIKFFNSIYKNRENNFLREYPDYWKIKFSFTLIRMAINVSSIYLAKDILASTNTLINSSRDSDKINFYNGKIEEIRQNYETSLNMYNKCSLSTDDLVKQECLYAKNSLLYKIDNISSSEYIKEISNITTDWHGDIFEAIILYNLADEYKKNDKLGYAIKTWQRIIKNGSNLDLSTLSHRNIIYSFINFYDKNYQNKKKISSFKRIAFYNEFNQYLPIGQKGDEIMISIIDDFIELGLWKNAASIIQYQILYRLSYYEKEKYIYKLSQIYMDNGLYKKAYEILNSYGLGWKNFSGKLSDMQKYMSAKALVKMGKYNEVEKMLEKDYSNEADDILSDMYWSTYKWNKFLDRAEPSLYLWRNNNYTVIGYDNVFNRDMIIKQPKFFSQKNLEKILKLSTVYSLIGNKRLYNDMYITVRDRVPMDTEHGKFIALQLDFLHEGMRIDNNIEYDYYTSREIINNLKNLIKEEFTDQK